MACPLLNFKLLGAPSHGRDSCDVLCVTCEVLDRHHEVERRGYGRTWQALCRLQVGLQGLFSGPGQHHFLVKTHASQLPHTVRVLWPPCQQRALRAELPSLGTAEMVRCTLPPGSLEFHLHPEVTHPAQPGGKSCR